MTGIMASIKKLFASNNPESEFNEIIKPLNDALKDLADFRAKFIGMKNDNLEAIKKIETENTKIDDQLALALRMEKKINEFFKN
jgi:hypothetical protein